MSCISGLMAARDPRATNELQVMALFCLGYSLLIRSLPHALQIVGSRCPVPLYLSNPQSIFQRLGHSRANWRNCYWFSVFVYLWSFPGPFLEYSHPIMDKVRFVDQPKLEESDIWRKKTDVTAVMIAQSIMFHLIFQNAPLVPSFSHQSQNCR